MGKGGYQIIDLTKYGNIGDTPIQAEKGLYAKIEGATKPLYFTHLTLDGVDITSQFAVPIFSENYITITFTSQGRILYITDDNQIYTVH